MSSIWRAFGPVGRGAGTGAAVQPTENGEEKQIGKERNTKFWDNCYRFSVRQGLYFVLLTFSLEKTKQLIRKGGEMTFFTRQAKRAFAARVPDIIAP